MSNKVIIGIVVGIAALFFGVLIVVFAAGFIFYRAHSPAPPVAQSAPIATTQLETIDIAGADKDTAAFFRKIYLAQGWAGLQNWGNQNLNQLPCNLRFANNGEAKEYQGVTAFRFTELGTLQRNGQKLEWGVAQPGSKISSLGIGAKPTEPDRFVVSFNYQDEAR